MDAKQQFIKLLEQDVQYWEEAASFWEDQRVSDLERMNGSEISAKELVVTFRARADKYRELISTL